MFNKKKFLRYFEEILESENDLISGNENLKELAGWDSLALIGLIAMLDKHYNVMLAAEELNQCKTVNALIEMVEAEYLKKQK